MTFFQKQLIRLSFLGFSALIHLLAFTLLRHQYQNPIYRFGCWLAIFMLIYSLYLFIIYYRATLAHFRILSTLKSLESESVPSKKED